MLQKLSILGISVTTSSRKSILSYCSSVFSKPGKRAKEYPMTIVTPNPEQVMMAQKNSSFRDILNQATIALPDGVGLVWAINKRSKIKDKRLKIKRIAGVDFMVSLCRLAGEKGRKVVFAGGRNGVAKQAITVFEADIPSFRGIAVDGLELPENNTIPDSVINHLVHVIRANNAACVFLGFGAPKQEYILWELKQRLRGERVIFMAVGGSFDMIAGKIRRAPKIVQNMGFEWLWRLIQEPWRWKRQLALPSFFWHIFMSGNQ